MWFRGKPTLNLTLRSTDLAEECCCLEVRGPAPVLQRVGCGMGMWPVGNS